MRTVIAVFLLAGLCFMSHKNAAASTYIMSSSEAAWLEELKQYAINRGVSPRVVEEALGDFYPTQSVIDLDRKQPESTITLETYVNNVVSQARIKKGTELLVKHVKTLRNIEQKTGVPPQIVVALWGIESNFGSNTGRFEVINSLATLVYEGRRADFFRNELVNALKILEQNNMRASELRGSWAGAMGQCQFMPSTYMNYAMDGDGDGIIDIWNSVDDVLASIANYIKAEGWAEGEKWGRKVVLTQPVHPDLIGLQIVLPLTEWAAMGVRTETGAHLPRFDMKASLIRPSGEGGDSFLVYNNFNVIRRWNRSNFFAVSVGTLSDRIYEMTLRKK
ncbi:MAG: lytic murein transglycosylase [Alphaproteobacteria bacterium]|nr:lytic murein transglycosylase [Alphaproteobacteria bacterium]MCL2505551.1 lytic murein transglycosylase [Alphaproteobacteria bacterium]